MIMPHQPNAAYACHLPYQLVYGMVVGLLQSDAARFGSLSSSDTCNHFHHYIRQISRTQNDDMLAERQVPANTFMPKLVLSCFMWILDTDTAY